MRVLYEPPRNHIRDWVIDADERLHTRGDEAKNFFQLVLKKWMVLHSIFTLHNDNELNK